MGNELATRVRLHTAAGMEELSLQMVGLYRVERLRPGIWRRFNAAVSKDGADWDAGDAAGVLYAAYLCANDADAYGTPEALMAAVEDRGQLEPALEALVGQKGSDRFRKAFARRTRGKPDVQMPKVHLDDVEDYYTLWVMVQGMPEDLFWHADWRFLISVAADLSAYTAWESSERRRLAAR